MFIPQVFHNCKVMSSPKSGAVFRCPHCGHMSVTFRPVCPECGRPFQRDYVDVRVHPRDPDLTGVVTKRSWARVFLLVVALWAAIMLFMWVYFHF
jgi:predicted amidophosphoribosyltransferase